MIQVGDVKPGSSFRHEGNVYTCLEISYNKTAMRQMIIKLRSKNLITGSITDLTFTGGGKVEPIFLDKNKMQYLYDDGSYAVFMNVENYEQVFIEKNRLSWELNFLVAETIVDVTFLDGAVIGVELPAKVVLTVEYTEPATKGDTAKTAMKDAIVETGLKVKVPLFVGIGDKLIIKTSTGEYDSRA